MLARPVCLAFAASILFFATSAAAQALGGGGGATTSQATLQHISGYTPPASSALGTPSVAKGSVMGGTSDIPGWSTQAGLVQATQGGVYFGGGNKDQSSGMAGSSPASSLTPALTVGFLASAAGVLFTLA